MRYLIFLLFFTFLSPNFTIAQCNSCDEHAFLGVYSNGISKKKAQKLSFDNEEGSYVTGVIGNTAAEEAGLQPFDYVIGIDEYRTRYDRSLTDILRKYEPGDKVVVHFYRNGKAEKRNTTLGERSKAEYKERSKKEDPFLGVEQNNKDMDWDTKGVKVRVVKNSTASEIGLESDDIITHINSFPILDWTDLGAAIDMMTVGEKMKVKYLRNGSIGMAIGNVRSLADTKYNSDNSNSYSYTYNQGNDNKVTVTTNTNGQTNTRVTTNIATSGNTNLLDEDERFEVERRNVDNMKVNLQEITQQESNEMKREFDVDMPIVNNLAVSNLTMSPNPSMGMFDLTFNVSSRGNTSINIYNAQGRKIYNYDLDGFSGAFEDRIDISQNGEGAYFLQIKQDGKSVGKKIILSRR